jgi:probable rRNA maturation factor
MIGVNVWNAHPQQRISIAATANLARRVLAAEHPVGAECSIVYIGDRRMKALNSTYLRHHRTTDVLTFPLHETGDNIVSGEVYVNVDEARRQAPRYGVGAGEELARLVIHGLLHLTGYDDRTPALRKRMSAREDFHLNRLRTGNQPKITIRTRRETNGG